jgi:UDP-glucose 4-epimerase
MKTLVTGGNGFIGQYVCEYLEANGHEAVVLDRECHPEVLAVREVHLGDIRDATAVTEAVAHVESVIHLAGCLGTQETIQNPLPAAETNILGGLNILQACSQYNVPVVNIAVGNYFENNTYSLTKDCVSRFCQMYRDYRDLPVTVVRALNAYGPRQSVAAPYGTSKVRKIMPSFVNRALNNDPIEIYGDGNQIMDMIYVADVAKILVRALESTMVNGGSDTIYSAGSGIRTTVNDIAAEVVRATGTLSEVTHIPMRPGETPGVVVLGDPFTLLPLLHEDEDLISLEEGVQRTVEFYRG